MNNIILMGFKGAGKTSTAKVLSKKLKTRYLDIDNVIEKLHEEGREESLAYRDIRKKYGPEYFCNLECQAVMLAVKENNIIIGLGGGTIKTPANIDLLKKNGVIVYLKVPYKVLLKRIKMKGIPAFLDPTDLEGSMKKELALREPIYEGIADVTINCDDYPANKVADMVLQAVKSKQNL